VLVGVGVGVEEPVGVGVSVGVGVTTCQTEPSTEVRVAPLFPTAANLDPFQLTPLREFVVPDVAAVQVAPSVE
jgi:hypothetical protein